MAEQQQKHSDIAGEMVDSAFKEWVQELVRRELADLLDEHIDKRVEAALKRSVLGLKPQGRNMEYK